MANLITPTTKPTIDQNLSISQSEIFSYFIEKFPNTNAKDFAIFILGWLALFKIKNVTSIQMRRAFDQIGFPKYRYTSINSVLINASKEKKPLICLPDGYTRFQKDNQYSLTITGRKKFRKDYREFALTMKTQTGQDD